jgi:hypothetical protein
MHDSPLLPGRQARRIPPVPPPRRAANLQGNHRLLHLSVSDHVDMLYGRKVQGVPDSPRWMESYTVLCKGGGRALRRPRAVQQRSCGTPLKPRRPQL